MRSKRKATNFPVRWQPYAEVTAAAAVACGGGEGSLHTSLLGGGDAKLQFTNDRPRPEPQLALSLRVGSEEEPQPQLQTRLRYALTRQTYAGSSSSVPPQTYAAPTRQSPSLLAAGSRVPPQTYAPGSSPAGAGLAPQPGSNNSLQLPLGPLGATPPEPRCGACSLGYDRLAADLLKWVSEELDRRVELLRQELSAEVRKEVLRIHATAAGVPLPGLGLPQPCGGAWRRCPACGTRPGTVVLKPYEHLCLCAQCSDAGRLCLHCSFTWTGAVETASRGRGGPLPSWPWP